jgi:hypothetical protein
MQRLEPRDLTSAPLDDVTRNRHGGNTYSELANIAISGDAGSKERRRAAVLAFIVSKGDYGSTVDECSAAFNLPPNVISGRFTELKKAQEIESAERERLTRLGSLAGVWRAKKGQVALF